MINIIKYYIPVFCTTAISIVQKRQWLLWLINIMNLIEAKWLTLKCQERLSWVKKCGKTSSGDRRRLGAKPPKMSLSPTAKHTGQESGGELCEIFKFWPVLQSESANNVYKLLQLLKDFGASTLTGGLCPPEPLCYSPQMKIPGVVTGETVTN